MIEEEVFIIVSEKSKDSENAIFDYRTVLECFFNEIGCKFNATDFFYKNRRPFLKNGYSISISRSTTLFFIGISKTELGIDAEDVRDIPTTRGHLNFLHPNEISALNQYTKNRFATIWTRKESLFKLIGTDFIGNAELFDCSKDQISFGSTYFFKSLEIIKYHTLSLCLTQPKVRIRILNYTMPEC